MGVNYTNVQCKYQINTIKMCNIKKDWGSNLDNELAGEQRGWLLIGGRRKESKNVYISKS